MTEISTLSIAQRVIQREADGLAQLKDSLGEDFEAAVTALIEAHGRVVVCGMGKSGHIARKIAATFASTGTPAQFLHAAEASHGDLGMVAKGDIVLALSYSGETPELAAIISYTRRFDITLIGVSSRPNSALAQQSDISIILPRALEACETDIVPSTSTTMTLALCDALAITLMEQRQFSPADFREFHPGGNLGAQLVQVKDLMHNNSLPVISAETPMPEVLLTITNKGFGVAGVVIDDQLAGIITDGDLRRHMDGLLGMTAVEVMTAKPLTIAPNALAAEALQVMNARNITTLFVLDPAQSKLALGIIHIHDCLRAGVS